MYRLGRTQKQGYGRAAIAAPPHEQEHHAGGQHDPAHDRRYEAALLGRDLERTHADLLPVAHVGNALECHHAT